MENMFKEDMKSYMNKMMEECCANMTQEDKQEMMEKCCASMTPDDMHKMMESTMMSSKMKGCSKEAETGRSKENRNDLVLKIAGLLVEQGSIGMSEEEKKDFKAKLVDKIIKM